jgi:CxxC motif-containing protein (DUF1111 family)
VTVALRAAVGVFAVAVGGSAARGATAPEATAAPAGAELEVYVGRSFFNNSWIAAPSSTTARDGLGPLFNAHACAACHPRGGRGRAPTSDGEAPVSLLLRLWIPPAAAAAAAPETNPAPRLSTLDPPLGEPNYGNQLQTRGLVSGPARVPAEGKVFIEYETSRVTLDDGEAFELRRPVPRLRELGYGPLREDVCFSLRIAPSLRGVGLLAAIPDAVVRSWADPEDADGNGISGRARTTLDRASGGEGLGRFGHRALQPTLEQQVASAFRDDVGITNALFREESCTEAETDCRRAPTGASRETGVEIDERIFRAVVTMAARLKAPPAPVNVAAPSTGGALFERAGCGHCHLGSDVVTADRPQAFPYTDLLLHDLGPGLADRCDEPGASGSEWRTAPLWGIGKVPAEQRAFLHDGRARSIAEAILWHGGEAEPARRFFAGLDRGERDALIGFVESR